MVTPSYDYKWERFSNKIKGYVCKVIGHNFIPCMISDVQEGKVVYTSKMHCTFCDYSEKESN